MENQRIESGFGTRENALSLKTQEMFKLAKDVGSGSAINEMLGELWFKTWQEALDFQTLSKEQGLELTLIEPDPKPRSFAGEYFKLRAKI